MLSMPMYIYLSLESLQNVSQLCHMFPALEIRQRFEFRLYHYLSSASLSVYKMTDLESMILVGRQKCRVVLISNSQISGS